MKRPAPYASDFDESIEVSKNSPTLIRTQSIRLSRNVFLRSIANSRDFMSLLDNLQTTVQRNCFLIQVGLLEDDSAQLSRDQAGILESTQLGRTYRSRYGQHISGKTPKVQGRLWLPIVLCPRGTKTRKTVERVTLHGKRSTDNGIDGDISVLYQGSRNG